MFILKMEMPVANWLNWHDSGPLRTRLCYRPVPEEILNNNNFSCYRRVSVFHRTCSDGCGGAGFCAQLRLQYPDAPSPPLAHKMALRWRDISCDWRETRRRLKNTLSKTLAINYLTSGCTENTNNGGILIHFIYTRNNHCTIYIDY